MDWTGKIAGSAWWAESTFQGGAPTMLSPGELKMLEWLARTMGMDAGTCIVDAGAFLGGSTLALATGLAANAYSGNKQGKIHSYDMFLAADDSYSQAFYGRPYAAGESVLHLFKDNTAAFTDLIAIHAGDFSAAPAPEEQIGLLFLDVAKSWELNDRSIQSYFPKLVPGRSILVQQDHNDHSCPWVNITMEYFARHFEYLADQGASRVYLCTSAITPPGFSMQKIVTEEKLRLIDQGAARSKHADSAFLSLTSKSHVLFEERGLAAAVAYLDKIAPQQPWKSPTPYVDLVKGALTHLDSMGGYKAYLSGYFKS